MSLPLPWSQRTVLVARNSNRAMENLNLPPDTSFQTLKDFSGESVATFWYCIMSWVDVWKSCITQWTSNFQMIHLSCYKTMDGWTLPQRAWCTNNFKKAESPKVIDAASNLPLQLIFMMLPCFHSLHSTENHRVFSGLFTRLTWLLLVSPAWTEDSKRKGDTVYFLPVILNT